MSTLNTSFYLCNKPAHTIAVLIVSNQYNKLCIIDDDMI
jgi:hypothetical protein